MKLVLTREKYRKAVFVVWFLFILLITFLFFEQKPIEVFAGVFIAIILTQLTLIQFLKSWLKYKKPKLLDWFRLSIFLTLILDYLLRIPFVTGNRIAVNETTTIPYDTVYQGLLVIFVGLFGLFVIEFLFLLKRKKNKVIKRHTYERLRYKKAFLFIAFLISLIQIYLLTQGIVGYGVFSEHTTASYSFLIQISQISPPILLSVFAVVFFIKKNKSNLFKVSFLLFFMLQVFIGLLSGMKEQVLTPIIICAIPYLYVKKAIPQKLLASLIIGFILLYPLNNNYRNILNKHNGIGKYESLIMAVEEVSNESLWDNLTLGSDSYKSRLSMFPILLYSIHIEKEWDRYKYMNRYVYLPISWIVPRFLLPSKPMSGNGRYLNYKLTKNDKSAITPSTFGWSYLEGGLVFVFLTFFIFGFVLLFIQDLIKSDSILSFLFYIMMFVSLLKVESDIYFRISGLMQSFLITYIFYRVFFVKKNGRYCSFSV